MTRDSIRELVRAIRRRYRRAGRAEKTRILDEFVANMAYTPSTCSITAGQDNLTLKGVGARESIPAT